jgi:hypothetical protein
MVEHRITDGRRIAQLLASELTARTDGPLAGVALTDVDRDAEPTPDGTLAYRVALEGRVLCEAFLQPERVRLEFRAGVDRAAESAGGVGLRVRPKAVEPPRTLVFVESGAAVKRALDVVRAVAAGDRDREDGA